MASDKKAAEKLRKQIDVLSSLIDSHKQLQEKEKVKKSNNWKTTGNRTNISTVSQSLSTNSGAKQSGIFSLDRRKHGNGGPSSGSVSPIAFSAQKSVSGNNGGSNKDIVASKQREKTLHKYSETSTLVDFGTKPNTSLTNFHKPFHDITKTKTESTHTKSTKPLNKAALLSARLSSLSSSIASTKSKIQASKSLKSGVTLFPTTAVSLSQTTASPKKQAEINPDIINTRSSLLSTAFESNTLLASKSKFKQDLNRIEQHNSAATTASVSNLKWNKETTNNMSSITSKTGFKQDQNRIEQSNSAATVPSVSNLKWNKATTNKTLLTSKTGLKQDQNRIEQSSGSATVPLVSNLKWNKETTNETLLTSKTGLKQDQNRIEQSSSSATVPSVSALKWSKEPPINSSSKTIHWHTKTTAKRSNFSWNKASSETQSENLSSAPAATSTLKWSKDGTLRERHANSSASIVSSHVWRKKGTLKLDRRKRKSLGSTGSGFMKRRQEVVKKVNSKKSTSSRYHFVNTNRRKSSGSEKSNKTVGGAAYKTSPNRLQKQGKTPTAKNAKQKSSKLLNISGNKYLMNASRKTLKRVNPNQPSTSKTPDSIPSKKRLSIIISKAATGNQSVTRHIHRRSVKNAILYKYKKKAKASQYCMFYNRYGKCNKGDKCPYIHDPSKIAVCTK